MDIEIQKPALEQQYGASTELGNVAETTPQVINIAQYELTYCSSFFDNEPITLPLEGIVEIAKKDEKVKKLTEAYRELKAIAEDPKLSALARNDAKGESNVPKQKLPVFIPGALCEGGKKRESIKTLLPFMGMDFDYVVETKIPEILECLRKDEHVVFASLSPSGKGLRAVCRVDGMEEIQRMWDESSKSARTNLYKYAYKQVADYFEALTGVRMDEKCANPEHAFTIAHDPEAYFNPSATPLKFDMSEYNMPAKGRPKKGDVKAKTTTATGSGKIITYVLGKLGSKGERPENGRNDFLYKLSAQCNRHGMDKDALKDWAIGELAEPDFGENEISATIESAYSHTEEFGTESIDNSIIEKIRELMCELADYRFNLTTNRMEMLFHEGKIDNRSEYGWEEVTDRHLNTIYTFVRSHVKTNKGDVDAVLYTFGFAPEYHPMLAYIQDNEPWDPSKKDYIEDLFNHIRLVKEDLRPRL